jgi:uncharacterized protein (TIGR02266 family)
MTPQAPSVSSQPLPQFRARRITFVYPVHVQLVDQPQTTLRAHATNLSLGGMFIYAIRPLPPGTRVRLALEVRGRALLLAEAEVRWSRENTLQSYPWCPGFGVRFVKLPPRAVALVHRLVTLASKRRDNAMPDGLDELDGVPVPRPERLFSIADLKDPADDEDEQESGTQVMFPPVPVPEAAPDAVPFAAVAARPASTWRWVRWGLVAATLLGWGAAFAHAAPGASLRQLVAWAAHPPGR